MFGGLRWSQESIHQGGAGDWDAHGEAKEHGGAMESRTEELKGASGDEGEELEGVGRGGGCGRLDSTSGNKGDRKLGRTGSSKGDRRLGGTTGD